MVECNMEMQTLRTKVQFYKDFVSNNIDKYLPCSEEAGRHHHEDEHGNVVKSAIE